MKKDKKEIRNLLLGKAVVDEEGRLVTPEAGTFRVPNGIADGAGAVRFLGVSGKTQYYETDLSEEEIMARAREHMRNSGRGVYLRQHPDAAACLKPGGALFLVIRKQQGAESCIRYLQTVFSTVEKLDKSGGFWVLKASGPVTG